jgi:hypothetical protein
VGETSYPYAGGGGVTDARYESMMSLVTGNGRLAHNPSSATLSQGLVYADSTGRQVKVRASQSAIVRGFKWETDSSGLLQPIDANSTGQTRLDLAVLRLNRETWDVNFRIVKGVAGTTPVPPAATQQPGPDGVWEWPIATIRVTSSASSGLPSIGLADVTPLDHFIAQQPLVGHSSRRPPASWGAVWTEYDTGRTYVGKGGAWMLTGEDEESTRLTPGEGWEKPGFAWATRRNGYVFLQSTMQWIYNDRAAGTDITLFTLPAKYRPFGDLYALGWFDGGNVARVYIQGSTGRVYMATYSATFKKNNNLTLQSMVWPTA